jgi:Mn-containing catalase
MVSIPQFNELYARIKKYIYASSEEECRREIMDFFHLREPSHIEEKEVIFTQEQKLTTKKGGELLPTEDLSNNEGLISKEVTSKQDFSSNEEESSSEEESSTSEEETILEKEESSTSEEEEVVTIKSPASPRHRLITCVSPLLQRGKLIRKVYNFDFEED